MMKVAALSQAINDLENERRILEERGDPEAKTLSLRMGDQIEILRTSLIPLGHWLEGFEREEGRIIEFTILLDTVRLGPRDYRRLRKPLRLTVRWGGEYFVAKDDKTVVAGAGDTIQEVLEDYFKVWGDRYNWLVENEVSLGPGPKAELRGLRRLLV